ncbi:unnamed protein product (macronuclear) [Paramecium tetraurelia]|uniref:YbaK/aminoacyl-tRNA synthetase-associated domain-containing protein n=1 Tax=Paramecium tetraurelia TaxID=5888 RepID=A0BP62_PARTE|nr:uncharacterized protein GSPATT00005078001 [Paramecium tetraurelia]CAK60329.1 unnamed protein product [Paramecium tetraurelia]|eukprot:XP_001427727.1 hypothetical protein (macronuclear) [Paramecium tetraurelia strain d4-2]
MQENTQTFEAIQQLLNTNNIQFKLLIHEPTKTSEESAKVRGVSLDSGAKAMLLQNKKTQLFILCVMSASKKLSWKLIRKLLDCKQLDLANEQQVYEVTKCVTGAVPPFGSIFKVQTYLDPSLITQGDQINFNCGLRTHSVAMSIQDYLKIENPIQLQFCE